MSTIINGSSPSITFSDSTTQASAGLTAASPTIASGVLTFPDATTQSSGSGVAKAWVYFNSRSGACVVNASYNVSSVTYVGTGNYQVNFTNAMADANYCIVASGAYAQSNGPYSLVPNTYADVNYSPTTTNFRLGALVAAVGWSVNQQYSYAAIFR